MTLSIIRADENHLDQAAALFDAYRVFYQCPSNLAAARAFLGERIRNSESVIFLAVDASADSPKGFAQLYPSFSSTAMRRIWILNDLFVAADHRREGVGSALLEAIRRYAVETSAARVELVTDVDNRTAQQLYAATGYERDEVFQRHQLPLN